ncbi:MAG: riboflavin biosynthesis protein RibF [Candidatus Omnitrophica bacterium]|nr:riboflavin biosynthesis protein RibF [Candidatus Omnitrophota bacterium]
MKVFYGYRISRRFTRPVVALGVFDGVHRGHRDILRACAHAARRSKGESVVITFRPHPGREESLYSLDHRLRLIQETGVDVCLVIGFTAAFSRMPAEDFVRGILCKRLGARAVYVGRNYRFGSGARGSVSTLRELSGACGFRLRVFDVVRVAGIPVSSTRIRELIKKGKLSAAARLLGRPVSILGTVIHGAAFGRRWGVPTANINPNHEVIPPEGVYLITAYVAGRRYKGVCYIGEPPRFLRSTKGGRPRVTVEAHLFRFNGNIYDMNIEIRFHKRLRARQEFTGAGDLIKQINKDIKKARSMRLLAGS